MEHRYYDFYMRFDNADDAVKAQEYYNKTHKPAIGGKFIINDNGVCSLSLRDDCQIMPFLYDFGLKRFIVTDNEHGFKRNKEGKSVFEVLTDNDKLYTFNDDEKLFENINNFLKEGIHEENYIHEKGTLPPVVKRYDDSLSIDDIYDMLDVNVPGLDY